MIEVEKLIDVKDCARILNHLQSPVVSINQIITILDTCAKSWNEGSFFYNKAQEYLVGNPILDNFMDQKALSYIPEIFSRKNIEKRIISELGSLAILDDFEVRENYAGKTFFSSLGTVLHVTAGNVFLGALDSLLMGIITKNKNIVKLSQNNITIPKLFMESLIKADKEKVLVNSLCFVSFKGGSEVIENYFKSHVDAILTWGGEEMVLAYQKNLSPRVKLINHGPKISFHVIDKTFLDMNYEKIFTAIAHDIGMWNQQACANSQNIFISDDIDYDYFTTELAKAMAAYNKDILIDTDDWVEKHKEYFLGLFSEFESGHIAKMSGTALITFEKNELSTTSLNNSIKIKKFKSLSDLQNMIAPYKYYLQTCGLGAIADIRAQYRLQLAKIGVTRFTKPGKMLESLDGSAHDGSYALMELVKVINDENKEDLSEFLNDVNVEFYQDKNYKSLQEYPLIDGEVLQENSLAKNSKFFDPSFKSGYIYSSGGTSGDPKYAFYSYDEFKTVCKLLGNSYKNNGIAPGDRVANLFMAGNMWSSFNAVQSSLEYCGAIQFPIGGLVNINDFKTYITTFKIKCIFGLPSLLLEMANHSKGLDIEKIFYAGEAFSDDAKKLITKNWGCKQFISAGYASVDVGPIGYQDKTCSGTEHFLFDELVELEVIDNEAVITSKIRKSMPVIRYRTGDRVEVISKVSGKTKFRLLGRVDQRINIWGARFELSELQFITNNPFQIILRTQTDANRVYDTMEIIFENSEPQDLLSLIYNGLKDVRDTLSFTDFCSRTTVTSQEFSHNARTGKFKIINDLRC